MGGPTIIDPGRRRLLQGAALGAAVLALRPATSLFAMPGADGSTDGLVGFHPTPAGIRAWAQDRYDLTMLDLATGPDGVVATASAAAVAAPAGFHLFGVGFDGDASQPIGAVRLDDVVSTITDDLDRFGHDILDEPSGPMIDHAVDLVAPGGFAPTVIDAGAATIADGHGIVTALRNLWRVEQHAPTAEGDHLSSVTVSLDDTVVATLDDLAFAGPGRVTGTDDDLTLSIDDGIGSTLVFALDADGLTSVASLPGGPSTAVHGRDALTIVDGTTTHVRLVDQTWQRLGIVDTPADRILASSGPEAVWLVESAGQLTAVTP